MGGYAEPDTAMPAGAVEHEHNLLAWTGADGLSEGGEFHLEERDTDRRGQMKDGPARGRMDEADEIAPLEPVLHGRSWALPIETPDLVQDRLEPDAVLVDRPQFDLCLRKGGRHLPQQRP